MTRTPILDGNAVLLINDGCVTGIEFPNVGSDDNPTEPARISFNPCTAEATATAVAKAFLGLL